MRAWAAVWLFAATLPGVASAPQRLAEDQIKAGFLYNFTRFVEWRQNPWQTPFSPLELCIVDDAAIAELLTQASAGKTVNGRALLVRQVRPADGFKGCNVLFVGDTSERHAGQILAGLAGGNVLTVGESRGFMQAGGIFNFTTEDNQVKLELNLEAARRNGLQISAKLIAVSRLVSTESGGGELR